jgi:hypothetical protein
MYADDISILNMLINPEEIEVTTSTNTSNTSLNQSTH